jgi:exonuclease III
LSIFHGNIRSLRNKVDYISKIIEDYDIVFFTETHLDKLVLDKNIHFSGYDIPVRKDRNSDGGGIIMYYKTHVNIKRRVDLKNPLVECTWFELKTKLQNILINLIYRSERQSHHRFWDFFDAMLKNAMEGSNHLICMGDLNKNLLNLPSNVNDLISISIFVRSLI